MTMNTDRLGTVAANATMTGAAEYIRSKNLSSSQVDLDRLTDECRKAAKAALGQALADAKEALECGMGAAAEATFLASMKLAGIQAAKAVVG